MFTVKRVRFWLLLTLLLTPAAAMAQRITVLTHDSFALPKELVKDFTSDTGIEVIFLPAGDAGEVVNRAILTKARPIADLLYGVDDSLIERARNEGIFEPYASPKLAYVAPEFRFSDDGLVTPVNVGYVIPNLDRGWFERADLALPTLLEQLAEPAYRDLVVVENPATSSPGLAFLIATVARFGDAKAGVSASADSTFDGDWLDYWAALRDNGVSVADGWTDAYYTLFSANGGDRPLVVSYLTSPAAEVIFAEEQLAESPTANLECAGCAYRQIEAIGILKGTKQRAAAEAFIDFMLSDAVQEAIPMAMFVNPVVTGTPLPVEFERFAQLEPGVVASTLSSDVVQVQQRRWLQEWTAVVLQGRDPAALRSSLD